MPTNGWNCPFSAYAEVRSSSATFAGTVNAFLYSQQDVCGTRSGQWVGVGVHRAWSDIPMLTDKPHAG